MKIETDRALGSDLHLVVVAMAVGVVALAEYPLVFFFTQVLTYERRIEMCKKYAEKNSSGDILKVHGNLAIFSIQEFVDVRHGTYNVYYN